MKARCLALGAVAAAVLLWPGNALAQNNTAATAAKIQIGQGWIDVNMDAAGNTQRWYRYPTVQGRSYCVEGVSEVTPTLPQGSSFFDGQTSVFRADGFTLIFSNDEQQEPGGLANVTGAFIPNTPGRVCYIAPATEFNLTQVGNYSFFAGVKSYRWRVVETTLYCPWFFSGNGFEAFILIRNTTSHPVKAAVTLRSTAGVVLGTQTGTVPANGSFNLQVSDPAGFNLPVASGNVEIAFGSPAPPGTNLDSADQSTSNGSPGTLIANVTSLSFGSGVSFDTPFGPRADWTR
jgi:hypothetical protein